MVTMENLFDTKSLLQNNQFNNPSPFSYLGSDLVEWLRQILAAHKVENSPLILSEVPESAYISGAVYIAKGVKVEPTAMITGPAYIGPGSEIRHGAYIRGQVYVGSNCVVGHATEVKGSVFLDGAKAGHFAYVGDSILGKNVNLGAGTKLANLKLTNDEVVYQSPSSGEKIGSGLRKFGALIGDDAQTGCNSVLSPGTILMPRTAVLPCVHYRGTLKAGIAR